jgi:hypothetical protein
LLLPASQAILAIPTRRCAQKGFSQLLAQVWLAVRLAYNGASLGPPRHNVPYLSTSCMPLLSCPHTNFTNLILLTYHSSQMLASCSLLAQRGSHRSRSHQLPRNTSISHPNAPSPSSCRKPAALSPAYPTKVSRCGKESLSQNHFNLHTPSIRLSSPLVPAFSVDNTGHNHPDGDTSLATPCLHIACMSVLPHPLPGIIYKLSVGSRFPLSILGDDACTERSGVSG